MATPPPPPDRCQFTPPDWSGDVATQLKTLREYAEGTIQNELDWYFRKKKTQSSWSQRLRWWAIGLSVAGGLVPLMTALFARRPEWAMPGWLADVRFGQLGYVLLAIAAGLVLFDKYFGYSTAWMRYIVAIQSIEKTREAFRLDWVALSRKLANSPQPPEQTEAIDRMIQSVRTAILDTKEQSEKETQAWILEFQTNLAQFEKDLKTQMEAGRPGGIDIEVTDGNKADTETQILLDGMGADRFRGTAGSIGYVTPGIHRVTATAKKDARDYSASQMVNVGGGQICKVTLTLNIP